MEFVRLGSVCTGNTSPAVINLSYDAQGNVQNKTGATGGTYTFDYGNRLRGTAGLSYRYDADGRRVRQDSAGANLKYSYYARDGRLVWQRDDAAGKRIHNLYLAGSLIAEFSRPVSGSAETIAYLHTDALGSPIAKTDGAGAVIERSEYEPYGDLLNRPNDDRAGYTGHVMDSASGLTYMQQRYYDPVCGCFLSVDPVTAYGGDYRFFTRYAYAFNNPYKFNDPDGRAANFIIKGVIDIGLEVAVQYATTGTVNPRTVITEVAKGALNPLKTVERARDLARIAKGVDKAGDAAKGAKTAGRYEFPDKKNGDKPYVGQSCNCERRLDQHQQAGRYEPGTASVTPVEGGKTAREISEHNRIQEITGGVPARQSDAVSNKVDPIGPARRHLLEEKK